MHESMNNLAFKAGQAILSFSDISFCPVYVFYPIQSYDLTAMRIIYLKICMKSIFTNDGSIFEILDDKRYFKFFANNDCNCQSKMIRP